MSDFTLYFFVNFRLCNFFIEQMNHSSQSTEPHSGD